MGAKVSKPERKFVLFGKTGVGKSSTGNTILQENLFKTTASPSSETKSCASGQTIVNGRKISVIDTPGIFDTSGNEEIFSSEIIKSITEMGTGVDMCIMILNVGRYTEQEKAIIDHIKSFFIASEDTLKHISILFTHGEDLEGQTIEEFIKKNAELQELAEKCKGRCFVIDNKHWKNRLWGYKSNRVQVRNLLKTADTIEKENGYNNELLHMVDEVIENEEKNIKEDNLSSEGKREKAKKRVYEKLCIKLAGVSTGMLIGAFLGIGVAVAAVVALLKAGNFKPTLKPISLKAASSAPIIAGVVLGTSALVGAVGGGLTGWDEADEADSVCDVITKTAKANYEGAKNIFKMAEDLINNDKE